MDEDAIKRVEGELERLRPQALAETLRGRLEGIGGEQLTWRERGWAGLMGMSVAAGVYVAIGLAGAFWGAATGSLPGAGGAVIAGTRQGEGVEMPAGVEPRLVRMEGRGEWRSDWRMMEVPDGNR